MKFWNTLNDELIKNKNLILLYVLKSEGSSPGRQGFKMLVGENGWMLGSIGGGFMEHKLVELAKSLLEKGSFDPFIKNQIHRTNEKKDRSGMICSGEQIVAFYYLDKTEKHAFKILEETEGSDLGLHLDHNGIQFLKNSLTNTKYSMSLISDQEWSLNETLNSNSILYIIGAGHVGLALSELMSKLDFNVTVIDDRSGLNTLEKNNFVRRKEVINYEEINNIIEENPQNYIVLMSFGYRTDKLILSKLLNTKWKYFGVLGSKSKMEKLIQELKDEGYDGSRLNKLHTPIGLRINSKTPMEIAVSIAAELISEKNVS